jgi:predicted RNA-binding Zn ribbon-like protein
MLDPEFPVLGTEPLSVELANTLYGAGAERFDFLRTARWVDGWFALVSSRHGLPPGAAAMGRHATGVRTLRDAVRRLLLAAVDGVAPARAALATVNGFAAAAPTYPRLDWPAGGVPVGHRRDTTAGGIAVLGRIAACCIELLAGPRAGELRRCGGPGCTLLFVRNHPRRRWCHPSCGHRDRQARYYRRHLAPAVAR